MKKTWHFIIITCLGSWILASILRFAGITAPSIAFNIFGMVYMLIPATVAILLQKLENKEPIKKPLLVSFKVNRWFLVALLTPIVFVALSLGTSLLVPGVSFSASAEGLFDRYSSTMSAADIEAMREEMSSFSQGTFVLLQIVQGLVAGCTINALFALGEELGWRGYMLHHLRHLSFMKVSLLTGSVWGLWHFPLILQGHNYPNHPVAGVFMMIVFCTLLSPLMTYIVIKSKSVITAALFHGTMNAFAGFPLIYLVGGNDLSNGLTGYAGFIAIIIVTLGFYLFDKYVTKENIFAKTVENSLNLKKTEA
ncbi:CPBP family intramembrane metalloprotease [Paludibacter sp. 221]|uniref:CPBP family intramembrane glutamic endopeptidase n=1 Tax=Paludibacter sp. 221 TaxID=2302939 RepID=UPI0013D26630|nr:CPBP family intramembrane glutamic endopeptidase [Paludibacter sp. 221]NDV46815.1 CPBP family intramembrane metalloprotease [Paludibacter sp. 221]